MATTVNEIWQGRDYSINYKRERNYTRCFRVIVDDPLMYQGQVVDAFVAAMGIEIGDEYDTGSESDPYALVEEINASQDSESWCTWTVKVRYTTVFDIPEAGGEPGTGTGGGSESGDSGTTPGNLEDNPIDRRTVWEYDGQFVTRATDRDLDGKPFINSARQYLIPPQEIEDKQMLITVSKNFQFFDQNVFVQSYMGAVNVSTWKTYPAGYLRIVDFKCKNEFFGNSRYFAVTVNMLSNPALWNPTKILDAGLCERVAVGGGNFELREIKDGWGNTISSPVLLNGNGLRLTGTASTGVVLSFRKYPWVDFNGLGF